MLGISLNLALVGILVMLGRRRSAEGSGREYRAASTGPRVPGREYRAAALGVAAGSTFGLTAALMKGMTKTSADGLETLFTSLEICAMVAAGLLGMFLVQSALNAGRLIAAQPGLTLAAPVISVLWGVFAFHEEVRGGWYILPEVISVAVMAAQS